MKIWEYKKTYDEAGLINQFRGDERRIQTLISLLPKPKQRVLDVGCAEGTFAILLSKLGYDVVGVDISSRFVKKARKLAKKEGAGARFYIANVEEDLDIQNGKFDVVVMTEVLEHLISPTKALRNIWNVLKQDGIAIISVPNVLNPVRIVANLFKIVPEDQKTFHLNYYDLIGLDWLLRLNGFKIEKLTTCDDLFSRWHTFLFFLDKISKKFPQISKMLIVRARKVKPLDTKKLIAKWKTEILL